MTQVDAAGLLDILRKRAATQDRLLVAIAGAPGSGKSTLAATLGRELGEIAAVVPMDGFHLDNDTLNVRGRLARKGAPDTFDVVGFTNLVARLSNGEACAYPTFDRVLDCAVPDGGRVPDTARILILEGNYLLLRTKPWSQLAQYWDITVLLDVSLSTLRRRLIERWLDHQHSQEQAVERAEENDIPNATAVVQQSADPHYVINGDGADATT